MHTHVHDIHTARYYVAQLNSTLYSISHTNKCLRRRVKEKNHWSCFHWLKVQWTRSLPPSLTGRLSNTHTHSPHYATKPHSSQWWCVWPQGHMACSCWWWRETDSELQTRNPRRGRKWSICWTGQSHWRLPRHQKFLTVHHLWEHNICVSVNGRNQIDVFIASFEGIAEFDTL